MMGTCAGLLGPKSENVDFMQVFLCFFEVQGRGEEFQGIPGEQFGTPRGGIKGGVNPSSEGRRGSGRLSILDASGHKGLAD